MISFVNLSMVQTFADPYYIQEMREDLIEYYTDSQDLEEKELDAELEMIKYNI